MTQGPQRLAPKESAAALLVGIGLVAGACGLGWVLWSATGLPPAMAVHAALMIVAWGVMLPAGGIVARYFKARPHASPAERDILFWWRWHRGLQYAGVAAATAGLAAILSETGGRFDTLHGRFGLVVMAAAWLQIASAWVRGSMGGPTDARADPRDPASWRGDHYDMSRRRLLFEGWHKRVGWGASALAGATILLGVALVGTPVWLLLLVAVLQGAALLTVLDSVLRRRWVDTYQALWGVDPAHPGNQRAADRGRSRSRGP